MRRVLVAIACSFVCATAYAGPSVLPLPEPGILELLGIAAVVGAVVAVRKRRRK